MNLLAFFLSMLLLQVTSGTTCYERYKKAYQACLGAQDSKVVKDMLKKVVSEEQTN